MVYLFLADGFEETEAFVPWDILKRGGLTVKTVGVTGMEVTGAHSLTVKCDIDLEDVNEADGEAFILPGGMPGTENLDKNEKVKEIIKRAYDNKKVVGAICAAPMVLGKLGMLKGRRATCFPGFEEYLEGAILLREHAVRDENVITAIGAGAAFDFGFALLWALRGAVETDVRKSMQYDL